MAAGSKDDSPFNLEVRLSRTKTLAAEKYGITPDQDLYEQRTATFPLPHSLDHYETRKPTSAFRLHGVAWSEISQYESWYTCYFDTEEEYLKGRVKFEEDSTGECVCLIDEEFSGALDKQ